MLFEDKLNNLKFSYLSRIFAHPVNEIVSLKTLRKNIIYFSIEQ